MAVPTHSASPAPRDTIPTNYRRRLAPVFGLLALALPILLAACGSSSTSSGGATGTLLFGAPISLTGSLSVEGNLTLEGYKIWVDTVNSHGGFKVGNTTYKVALKYYDDASDPNKSKQLTQTLVTTDKVNFLLGPYGSPATLQDEAIAEQYQIPMVEGNGAAASVFSKGYKYIFGVLSPAADYAAVMIQAAMTASPPPANIAIISADDAFSQEVAKAAQAYALSINLPVVFFETYPSGATDLTNVMTALKTSANGAAPDFILGSGHEGEAVVTMKTAKQLGINAKLYGFTVGPGTPDFITALGADSNDVISSAQWTPQEKYTGVDYWSTPAAYQTAYLAKFGHQPAYQSAESTACGVAFQYAMQAAGSIDPTKVRDALAALDIQTFYGEIKFNAQGQNVTKPMATTQIQNGALVTVFPTNVANAALVYPTPPFGSR